MSKLRIPIQFDTTFDTYLADEILGEGGAGRVYGATASDDSRVAIKLLANGHASSSKRRRFKNELGFLLRNRHRNVVTVLDHGLSDTPAPKTPFYVMARYDKSLRDLMRQGLPPSKVLNVLSQLLDGLEAAHLQGVIHRDIKPENILFDSANGVLAIADFGIAHYSEELLVTMVETRDSERLANVQYAAPEQHRSATQVDATADLYAVGLILNEMFTGVVPHGTEYKLIASVAPEFAFLDEIVAQLIRQEPAGRPRTVLDLKGLIEKHRSDAVARQRISRFTGDVIKVSEIDDPLATTPPRIVGANWDGNFLTIKLDQAVNTDWISGLLHMSSHEAVMGKGPSRFTFNGDEASISAEQHEVQPIIDKFKTWLPRATATMKAQLETKARDDAARRKTALELEKKRQETRLRVNQDIRF